MSESLDARRLPLLLEYALGFSSTILLPIWLGIATGRFGLSSAQTGALGSLELGCVALASLAAASSGTIAGPRSPIAIAVVVSLAGDLAAAFSQTLLALAAARAITGAAHGVLLADATRRAAQHRDAQRVFAAQQLALVIFAATFFASAPRLIALLGPGGPFLVGALLAALTLAALPYLRAAPAVAPAHRRAPRTAARTSLCMAFASLALTFWLQSAPWAYLSQSAHRAGLGIDALSAILAIGSVVNLAAPFAASLLGGRVRPTGPLMAGFAGLALATLGLGFGTRPALFAICAIALTACQVFLVPWLLSALVSLDPSGRAASAGPAFFAIGSAAGPLCGGAIVAAGGLGALGLACAGAALLALGFVTASTRSAPLIGAPPAGAGPG